MTSLRPTSAPITIFGPDFPFAYDDWLKHPQGLAALPASARGTEVAIVGAGMAGMTAAYELMKLGLKPVIYEVPLRMVPKRARDNRLYVAYANACGREGGLHYGGFSTVCGPDGNLLGQADRHAELSVVPLLPAAPTRK